jgi:hypothetical protein
MNVFILMLATIGAGVWLAWALAADRADAAAEKRAQAALSRRIRRRSPCAWCARDDERLGL